METDKIEVKVLFIVGIAVLAVEFFMGFLAVKNPSCRLMILGMGRIMEIGGIILTVMYFGNGLTAIGLAISTIGAGIKRGVVWSAGFGIIAILTGLVLYLFRMDPLALVTSGISKKLTERILLFLVGGIIGPVAEEVFFRGICYGFFRRWGVMAAVVLTTLVFVSAHSVRSVVPVLQIIGGVVFALAYEREKSLMVPITIHVTGNLAIFSLSCCV
jgi:membrane protease YdiL (CAAX protease family)